MNGLAPKEGPRAQPSTPGRAQDAQNREPELQVGGIDAGSILESGLEAEEGGADKLTAKEASEGIGEHRQATGGRFQQFKKQLTDDEVVALKAKLIKELPSPQVMRREVTARLLDERRELEKEAAQYERDESFSKLVNAVRRLREINHRLMELIFAKAEKLKEMWLEVIHGIV